MPAVTAANALALDTFLVPHIDAGVLVTPLSELFDAMRASQAELLKPFVNWDTRISSATVVATLLALEAEEQRVDKRLTNVALLCDALDGSDDIAITPLSPAATSYAMRATVFSRNEACRRWIARSSNVASSFAFNEHFRSQLRALAEETPYGEPLPLFIADADDITQSSPTTAMRPTSSTSSSSSPE